METNVNYTIVGAFVIALLSCIILAILWLSSGLSVGKYSTYLCYMQESVSGLSIDSQVEYNGVSVGTIKNIELNRKNPQLVEVLLHIKSSTPITRGTVATLTTRGLTGVAFIALKDKSTDLRPLVALRHQPYPVIPTTPSLFMRIDSLLSGLSKDFEQMADSLHSLLDKQNLESIKNILSNVQKITYTFAQNSKKVDAIFTNTERATLQVSPLLQSGSHTFKVIETQTLPAMYRVLINLDAMTQTLNELSVQLKQNPSMLIRGASPAPLGPGEKR